MLLALSVVSGCAAKEPITPSGQAAARVADVDWAAAEPVEVGLSGYAFSPAGLVFREGRAYRLHLVNRSAGEEHTFTAPAFFRSAGLRADAAGQQALAAGGEIVLAGGQSEDLYLVPLQKGRFDLRCSEPFHPMFGMTGEIIVQ
jgi:uncharacterized cupredoxin-like copper-binding protein